MCPKRFAYVCAGLLCLALTYHVGAMNAQAQPDGAGSSISTRVVTKQLVIVDEHGAARAEVGLVQGQPFLALNDKAGRIRVALSLSPDGSALLGLNDTNGTTRAMLATGDGGPALTLADSRGTERVQVGVTAADAPTITLMDETKAMRASIYIESDARGRPAAAMSLFDKSGKLLWHAQ